MAFKPHVSRIVLQDSVRLMFYNVENLFDTINSSKIDEEFLPSGSRRWNTYKYFRKLNNIYKVIVLAGDKMPPDIIGLCEVENARVMQDLINKTYLSKQSYGICYAESADERGIGNGLLINRSRFDLIEEETWYPLNNSGDTLKTRSILYAKIKDDIDTLHIIVTHWPSRRGGVMATEPGRIDVAGMIRSKCSELMKETQNRAKIIIMGDLNSDPDSETITRILGVQMIGNEISDTSLYCLHDPFLEGSGSYKYQGNWFMFDQIIVSGSLLGNTGGYSTSKELFRVVDDKNLLTEDNAYKATKPYSTWSGFKYSGGFSDHLPVVLDLKPY
jgi:endonuclease/exonuclease/phosphatase family metal-dependent hydrolase